MYSSLYEITCTLNTTMTFAADVFRWALRHEDPDIRHTAIEVIQMERRKRFPQTCHNAVSKPY